MARTSVQPRAARGARAGAGASRGSAPSEPSERSLASPWVRLLRFGIVGLTGLGVNQAVLWAATEGLGLHYLLAAVLATQASTLWNFVFTERWVFDGDRRGRLVRLFWFALMNYSWLALRTPFLYLLTDVAGLNYLLSNLLVLGTATLARFGISDRWIWSSDTRIKEKGAEAQPNGWRYDIHGLVRIESSAALPDLEWFLVSELPELPDLVIQVGGARFGGPRLTPTVQRVNHTVAYIEQLGGLGFAVRIRLGPTVKVRTSRLLGSSPYVLYANVVEPLLRWILARKGYALAHAACLEMDGHGILVTARTDTGKTTSCLKSVQEHGSVFLSDDMVILSPRGVAYAYPKPVTVSAHTLNAVREAPLSFTRRTWLQVQGRLHSRGGRAFGLALAKLRLPVATMNSVLQTVVNPPKFRVGELIPEARIESSTVITHMAAIEQGSTLVEPLSAEAAEAALAANTEDAYGFPPYPMVAGAISHGLEEAEAEVRRSLLAGARTIRIRASDRHWYEQLRLIADGALIPRTLPPPEFPELDLLIGLVEAESGETATESQAEIAPRPGSATEAVETPQVLVLPDSEPRELSLPRVVVAPSTVSAPDSRRLLDSRVFVFAAAGAILGLAAFLRLWQIDAIGFNSDEAVYSGQAATLSGDATLGQFFTPFRAHPLLLQTLLAFVFRFAGVTDAGARIFVAVAFGAGSVIVATTLAWRLYGRTIGLLTGLFLTLMPYHLLLSRQVLLDIPALLFISLAVWSTYHYARDERRAWTLRSSIFAGLAVATKETAAFLVPAMLLFLFWSGTWSRPKWKQMALWGAIFVATVAPFLLTRIVFGADTTSGYLLYQFFRPANHPWWYFPVVLWEFVTPPFLLVAVGGLLIMALRRSTEDKLLLSWLIVFTLFHQVWPTKLFPYMIAVSPVLAVAAGVALVSASRFVQRLLHAGAGQTPYRVAVLASTAMLLLPIANGSALSIKGQYERVTGPFDVDVEVQDFAGAREVAEWIGRSTPGGATFLTLGPSLGNIISFYGHRGWFGLSVSQNPKFRNPAYTPIPNPDLAIRKSQVHYAVWDAYSADRSAFFSARLMRYVRKYGGVPLFAAWVSPGGDVVSGRTPPIGADVRVVVYDLPGGDPLEPQVTLEGGGP